MTYVVAPVPGGSNKQNSPAQGAPANPQYVASSLVFVFLFVMFVVVF